MSFFEKLGSYDLYLASNPIDKLLNIDTNEYGSPDQKLIVPKDYAVDPALDKPYLASLDDLIRLHYLVISRKVTTILEFGVGKSSIVFDHALKLNMQNHNDFVSKNLRRNNIFQCYSIDNNNIWI